MSAEGRRVGRVGSRGALCFSRSAGRIERGRVPGHTPAPAPVNVGAREPSQHQSLNGHRKRRRILEEPFRFSGHCPQLESHSCTMSAANPGPISASDNAGISACPSAGRERQRRVQAGPEGPASSSVSLGLVRALKARRPHVGSSAEPALTALAGHVVGFFLWRCPQRRPQHWTRPL
jgi:hypothetical protein